MEGSLMSEQRKMTISRALTRIKTITAQMNDITQKIRNYGAWNDKVKHPYGDSKRTAKETLDAARKEVQSMYQSFNDLSVELLKLKVCIEKANLSTKITIGEKTMTIAEALIYKRSIETHVRNLVSCYNHAVARAQITVNEYNKPIIMNANLDTEEKQRQFADVAYLVDKEEIDKHDKFLTEFMTELDGTLNEINAITEIEIG
jgi:hypothetical protein